MERLRTRMPEWTALYALNKVRDRVGMPAVLDTYTTDKDALRPRIKNERTVELCFEGYHYFCDIRRWKDAPSIHRTRLTGMRVTKLKAGATAQYPTGFRYERFELPSNRQIALEERRHVLRAVPDERPAQNEELRTQRGVVVLIV